MVDAGCPSFGGQRTVCSSAAATVSVCSSRRAVLIRPDLGGALFSLAELTYEKGNIKESEAYLSRFMRLGEPNLPALVLGVKLARDMGDKAAEDSMLQQLRRRYPDAPQTRELLEAKR